MTSSPNGWFPAGFEDDNHNKYWSEHGHPELLLPQKFSKSSRNIWLKDDHILIAECCNVRGEYVTSTLDLNKVLGNDNGKFAPGGGFLRSCQRPVKFKHEGVSIHTKLSDFRSMHSGVHASLDRFIGNDNGKLVCAYWDEDRCPVCNSFPRPGAKIVQARDLKAPARLANCPSCQILDGILQTLRPKGFRPKDTLIRCIQRGESEQPEMIFECNKGDDSQILKEHFVLYQVSGKRSLLTAIAMKVANIGRGNVTSLPI